MTINRGLEFEFADCDSLLVELEEQYSYAETNDYQLNREAAQILADEINHEIGSGPWFEVFWSNEDID